MYLRQQKHRPKKKISVESEASRNPSNSYSSTSVCHGNAGPEIPKKGILLSFNGVETEAPRFKPLTHGHMTEEQNQGLDFWTQVNLL